MVTQPEGLGLKPARNEINISDKKKINKTDYFSAKNALTEFFTLCADKSFNQNSPFFSIIRFFLCAMCYLYTLLITQGRIIVKKNIWVVAALAITMSSSVLAKTGDQAARKWGVGAAFVNGGSPFDGALTVGYYDRFTAGLGYNLEFHLTSPNQGRRHLVYNEFLGWAGLRTPFFDDFNLTYGAIGTYHFVRNKSEASHDPYSLGAFVGVDYLAKQRLLISMKLMPYLFQRNWDNAEYHGVFTHVLLGMSILF